MAFRSWTATGSSTPTSWTARNGIQGVVERDLQQRAGLHAGRQGDPDAELRHAVLLYRGGSARGTAGAHRCRRSRRTATSRCSSSISTPSTSPTSAAAPPATAAAAFCSPGRGGRSRRPPVWVRHSVGDRLRLRPLSDAAVQSCRHREREGDPGGIQSADPVGIPRPARTIRTAGDFLDAAGSGPATDLAGFFNVLNFVLQFCPTHPAETELRARFATDRCRGRARFEPQRLSPEMRSALEAGMADAWKTFKEFKEMEIDTGKRPSGSRLRHARATLPGAGWIAWQPPCSGSTGTHRRRRCTPSTSSTRMAGRPTAPWDDTRCGSRRASCRP